MVKARLLVELDVNPEEADAFRKMFHEEFMSRSRCEGGCELYQLWHDPNAPHKMTIIEVWSSQAHLDAHLAQEWFAEWAPRMEAAQATPLQVRVMANFED
ncbi:MAG: hypothetical protein GY789_18055 [Hyphomicrobiales bacterium]|nr:hypothetical protein [Hyphomicrobiales bacterium]MCP4997153.1 hypothetical protein [Hyphomicrobiales bacterium]